MVNKYFLFLCFSVQFLTAQCWQSISASRNGNCVVADNGSLWSWGNNTSGELGIGVTGGIRNIPTQTGSDQDWKPVSEKTAIQIALKNDGSLWSWGLNNFGQLGHGNTTNINSPTMIGTASDWKSVYGGKNQEFAIAIKNNGTLWSWGRNDYGGLGLGDTAIRTVPTQIGSDTNWEKIAVGAYFALGIKTDGTLWTWGDNGSGQLGFGDFANRVSPTQVGTANDWNSIYCGYNHAIGVKNDGSIWVWGYNGYGQLGLGDAVNRNAPVQLTSMNGIQKIATSLDSTYFIKTDGTLWVCGRNNYGQLGLSDYSDRNTPTQLGVENNWQDISGGFYHALALKSDGTLWSWGYNNYGQLGDATSTTRTSPVAINCPAILGTQENKLTELKIFPNPTNSSVNFSEEIKDLELFDFTGKKIKSYSSPISKIDISQLENGVYFLKGKTTLEHIFNQKLIKN